MNALLNIANSINVLPKRNRSGTLQVWGEWFGRPMDNVHTCTNCEAQDGSIVLHCAGNERLVVWSPKGFKTRGFTLIIQHASRVRWEWYYYGRPQIAENLLFNDYAMRGAQITKESSAPWRAPHQATAEANAIELVGL